MPSQSLSRPALLTRSLIATAVCVAQASLVDAADRSDRLEHVEVVGQQLDEYLVDEMATATGLGLSIMDTPQSVSGLSQAQMRDFNLDSLNAALQAVPGIQVESVETDRTYYSSRGFDVTNFQVDGVGMPASYGNRNGETDTAIYERIEVVRGASGLMSGAGNPSATINMVRKRPLDELLVSVEATAGSWDSLRLESDISGKLAEGLRGRLTVAKEDRESYLDRYAMDKSVVYGVLTQDIGDATALTVGASYQSSDADSPLWGALPLVYSDGSPTRYGASTSTSADWSYWDNTSVEAFAELTHEFASGWEAKAYYSRADIEGDSELFYMYSLPDAQTGEGLIGYGSGYTLDEERELLDLRLTGKLALLGREHEVLLGYNQAEGSVEEVSLYDYTNGFPWIGDLDQWAGRTPVRPVFTDGRTGSDFSEDQSAWYAATRLHLTDALSLIGGARVVDWEANGEGYGTSKRTRESGKVLPYMGLVYRLGDAWSLYASHTESFLPQDDIAADLSFIDPAEGNTDELGVKAQFFEGKLIATLAYYWSEQANVAEFAGQVASPDSDQVLIDVYEGRDYDSEGYELTVSGLLGEGLQLDFSYTHLDIRNRADNNLNRDYIPAQTARLYASYRPPALAQLKVGAGINWQDDIARIHAEGFRIEQAAYATVQVFASYDLSDQLNLSLNAANLTDEQYISSLYWDQGFYAPPRNFSASVTWNY